MYNPNIHHRRSIRLRGYDYSQMGLYFLTICCQNKHIQTFGVVRQYTMVLNDAGKMIANTYYELENKFPKIRCHEMVVMPNHFHCIIEIASNPIVRATLVVAPNPTNPSSHDKMDHNIPNINDSILKYDDIGQAQGIAPTNNKKTLGDFVGAFKSITTNHYINGVKKYGWAPFDRRLWQRNYYEHIIRNEQAYDRIAQYILNNPAKWHIDKFNQ